MWKYGPKIWGQSDADFTFNESIPWISEVGRSALESLQLALGIKGASANHSLPCWCMVSESHSSQPSKTVSHPIYTVGLLQAYWFAAESLLFPTELVTRPVHLTVASFIKFMVGVGNSPTHDAWPETGSIHIPCSPAFFTLCRRQGEWSGI